MITAKKIAVFPGLFGWYCRRLVKSNFRRVRIGGEENFLHLDPGSPVIFFANHSSWWDAILPIFLSISRWRIDSYGMMDEIQLKKFAFFRLAGMFSVDRTNARRAVRSVEYAAGLLRGTRRSLWIYPQGELCANDTRPLVFYSGIEHIARRLGKVTLVPVALRYEFLNEQKPEAFIRIGTPVAFTEGAFPESGSLVDALTARLTGELDALRLTIIDGSTACFETILEGRRSISAVYDSIIKR